MKRCANYELKYKIIVALTIVTLQTGRMYLLMEQTKTNIFSYLVNITKK